MYENEINKRESRVLWIDVLKGIGIIFVVYGHVTNNDTLFNWLYSFHLPIFFFSSGYLYKRKGIKQNIKHKFMTIMVPYFCLGFLNLIYWYLIEKNFRENTQSLSEAVLGLLSGEYQYLEFNVHFWFLPCFYSTIIIYNILRTKFNVKRIFAFSALLAYIYNFITIPELVWGVDKVAKYMIFISLGEWVSKYGFSRIKDKKKILLLIFLSTLLLNIIISLTNSNVNKGIIWFANAFLGLIPWCILSYKIGKQSILEYFGRISLVILCVHGPVYRIIIKIFSMLSFVSIDQIRNNFFMTTIIVITTMFICFIINELIVNTVPICMGKRKAENE